jgi:hypothetical protein
MAKKPKSLIPTQNDLDKIFRPYGAELGRLLYSWNALHEALGQVFCDVTDTHDARIALAIWYSTPSDRGQREMLRAATEAVFNQKGVRSRAKEDIVWLVCEANNLANKRNDAIHSPLSFVSRINATEPRLSHTSIQAGYFYGNPRAKSLKGKDLLSEFVWYRATADALCEFAFDIHFFFSDPDEHPWPDRPRLPHRGQSQSQTQVRRQTPAKRSPPQPRSSRA